MSLTKLVARLRAHELSPREAVEGYLERIDARRDLNAYITVRAEEALAEADQTPRAPLYGAPIAVKDVLDIAGTRMTAASAILRDHVPYHDLGAEYFDRRDRTSVVRRLRRRIESLGYRVDVHEVA